MTYFNEIKSIIENHILLIESLNGTRVEIRQKVEKHLETSKKMDKAVNSEDTKKLKLLIEYLANESRNFGWTFPENEIETLCENSFWNMKDKIKKIVGGMTGNERLYYFGYLDEFDKIPLSNKSERDNILIKLFFLKINDTAPNRR